MITISWNHRFSNFPFIFFLYLFTWPSKSHGTKGHDDTKNKFVFFSLNLFLWYFFQLLIVFITSLWIDRRFYTHNSPRLWNVRRTRQPSTSNTTSIGLSDDLVTTDKIRQKEDEKYTTSKRLRTKFCSEGLLNVQSLLVVTVSVDTPYTEVRCWSHGIRIWKPKTITGSKFVCVSTVSLYE